MVKILLEHGQRCKSSGSRHKRPFLADGVHPTVPCSLTSKDGEESSKMMEKGRRSVYGLRQNPRKSIKLADPNFSFAVGKEYASTILDERNQRRNESTRAAARIRPSKPLLYASAIPSRVELKLPASVGDDILTEEDAAICLMMLSRDTWGRKKAQRPVSAGKQVGLDHVLVRSDDSAVEEKRMHPNSPSKEEEDQLRRPSDIHDFHFVEARQCFNFSSCH